MTATPSARSGQVPAPFTYRYEVADAESTGSAKNLEIDDYRRSELRQHFPCSARSPQATRVGRQDPGTPTVVLPPTGLPADTDVEQQFTGASPACDPQVRQR